MKEQFPAAHASAEAKTVVGKKKKPAQEETVTELTAINDRNVETKFPKPEELTEKDFSLDETMLAEANPFERTRVPEQAGKQLEKTAEDALFEQGKDLLIETDLNAKETAERSQEALEHTKERPISEFSSVEQFARTLDDFESQMLESKKKHSILEVGLKALEAKLQPPKGFFDQVEALRQEYDHDADMIEQLLPAAPVQQQNSMKAALENMRTKSKALDIYLRKTKSVSSQDHQAA